MSCPGGATGFSLHRFAAPDLVDRIGKVLYLDSDMVVYGDVVELFEHPFFGYSILVPENQAAVMLMDAEKVPFSFESVCSGVDRDGYRKGLMDLREGISGAKVGRLLSSCWNSLDLFKRGVTKNLHFTNMRNQPWLPKRPHRHPCADLWFSELTFACDDGVVTSEQVEEDVKLGYLHSECLESVS
jgi:hypothetical protein